MKLSKCVLSSAETMNEDPISTLPLPGCEALDIFFFLDFITHL